jgi:hypothetical protein
MNWNSNQFIWLDWFVILAGGIIAWMVMALCKKRNAARQQRLVDRIFW